MFDYLGKCAELFSVMGFLCVSDEGCGKKTTPVCFRPNIAAVVVVIIITETYYLWRPIS